MLNANFKFLFGLLGTVAGSIISAFILKNFAIKKLIPNLYEYC